MTLLELACRRLARRDGRNPDLWRNYYCVDGCRLRVQTEIDTIVNRWLLIMLAALVLMPVVVYFLKGMSCE